MPLAVTHSCHSKTLYTAFTLITLYENGQSYRVPHLYSLRQLKIHRTLTPAKWAMTTNTAFITQTVLCEAPYCVASLYYIHAQHKKSLPFTYNPASVVGQGWYHPPWIIIGTGLSNMLWYADQKIAVYCQNLSILELIYPLCAQDCAQQPKTDFVISGYQSALMKSQMTYYSTPRTILSMHITHRQGPKCSWSKCVIIAGREMTRKCNFLMRIWILMDGNSKLTLDSKFV